MIGLFVLLGKERTKRMTFQQSAIAIGADRLNDLVLRDGDVAEHHLAIAIDLDEQWFITPKHPIVIAGSVIPSSATPLRVNNGTRIGIGTYTLQLVRVGELSMNPVEQRLVAAIVARDEASRLVYADWLEERGDTLRAQFVRVQEACLQPAPPAELVEELRELSHQVDDDWRTVLARPLVENCQRKGFACPRDWGSMTATRVAAQKQCDACHQQVHYVTSIAQLRARALEGFAIAVDLRVPRGGPGDLPAMRGSMMLRR